MHASWLTPDWPAPAGVRALFTSRHGGVSAVPYDSLNLGDHVGDASELVLANRHLLRKRLGVRPVFLQQVHGSQVVTLAGTMPDGLQADACLSTQRDVACCIMVADCLPVLFARTDGTAVAAAHAGWRGLAGVGGPHGIGVLESVFAAFQASFMPPDPSNRTRQAIKIIAWLGPCIGPTVFEVGPEVKAAFETVQPEAGRLFAPHGPGKYLADLPGLARLRLQALGITQIYGNDGSAPWCTVSNPARFFSHRRDADIRLNGSGNGFGSTGRMAACIWLE